MKKLLSILTLLSVLILFSACSVSVGYSSNLDALKKWTDKYISTYYDLFKQYEGKTNADLIKDEAGYKVMVETQKKLASESYPYDSSKKMADVAYVKSHVSGDTAYFFVYTPIPDDDKDIAETMAEIKGDHYYVIGVVIIKADSDIQNTPDDKLVIKSVEKKVYVSSKLPVED